MSDTLKKHVGKRIRAARKGAGFTQEQLAALIEKSVETVSNLERGHTAPSLETLALLASALGYSADWFLVGYMAAPGSSEEGNLRTELETLLIKMNESQLQQVADIARIIKKP